MTTARVLGKMDVTVHCSWCKLIVALFSPISTDVEPMRKTFLIISLACIFWVLTTAHESTVAIQQHNIIYCTLFSYVFAGFFVKFTWISLLFCADIACLHHLWLWLTSGHCDLLAYGMPCLACFSHVTCSSHRRSPVVGSSLRVHRAGRKSAVYQGHSAGHCDCKQSTIHIPKNSPEVDLTRDCNTGIPNTGIPPDFAIPKYRYWDGLISDFSVLV